MTIAPQKLLPLQRLSAHKLALWLAGPVAAIVVVAILGAAWVVTTSAAQIDNVQAANERKLLQTAITALSNSVARTSADYAFWDETYDAMAAEGPVDLDWTEKNLGPYLAKTYGLTHFFVFDRRGEIRYASVLHGEGQKQLRDAAAPEIASLDLTALRASAKRLLAGPQKPETHAQGFVEIGGDPAFAVVRPIFPDSVERTPKDGASHALVILKTLDVAVVQEMSESYGLKGLRLGPGFQVALSPLNGDTPVTGFSWTTNKLGAKFARDNAETLLPLGISAVILMVLAGAGWWRAVASIRNAEIQALSDRARSVQETSRAKSLFVANMSHELRTPLNAIIGFSEVIKGQMFGPLNQPKYVEYAADIHASGAHLLGIVNNILTLSKIEAQQQRINIEDVGVADVVSEALRMCRPDAAKRKVTIESHFDGAPVARADPQALTQIAVNLLSNAIKFSEPQSQVRLNVTAANGAVTLTVQDTGCGIPPETLTHLGRPFTQAEDPYRRNYQGTGLGLSISFALAREMNGELRIESQVDQGTTATLTLPLTAAQENAATPAPHAA